MEFEEPKSSKKQPHHSGHQLATSNKKQPAEEKTINQFKSQMEYYFSDANLVKDKYLNDLIEKHKRGYVELVEFLKFNKIKDIARKNNIPFIRLVPLLIKGIERSDKIKLNKLNDKVQRKAEFIFSDKMKQDMNLRTIYVENLAASVTIEQVVDLFKKCGHIMSVDLPKFKNDQCKGFAFVQFNSAISIEEALKLNNTVPKELCETARSGVKPLRVISYADWLDYKQKFDDLKRKLRNIYTDKKKDKEYVYVKISLNKDAEDTTKDEVELYLKQIDVDTFYVDIVSNRLLVVKLWDYNSYVKLESHFRSGNELLSFINNISVLSDIEFREYMSKIKLRKDRIKRNKRNKKIKKKSA